jgi:hypothetical protein
MTRPLYLTSKNASTPSMQSIMIVYTMQYTVLSLMDDIDTSRFKSASLLGV